MQGNLYKFLIASAKIRAPLKEVRILENYLLNSMLLGPLSFDKKIGSSVFISLVQFMFSPGL